VRVRATISYLGRDFHGFAANADVVTVAGELQRVVSLVTGEEVALVGAGRTDAGVHARGQVVSFDAPAELDLTKLQRSVNNLLAPHIVMRAIEVTNSDFSARFDAKWRRYRYTVLNRVTPDPFLVDTAWHVPHPLNFHLLQLACDPLLGEHDFTSFCRRPKDDPDASLVRRVLSAQWRRCDHEILQFEIVATACGHQMVRSIVGLLVDVGRGRRTAGEVRAILRAKDRNGAAVVAPPQGLCLEEVGY
jgi:tRNA pseudouridine38-40 synthase